MQLFLNIQLAVLAFAAVSVNAAPPPPQQRQPDAPVHELYVPGMAPGSSPQGGGHRDADSSAHRGSSLPYSAASLPGVNQKPKSQTLAAATTNTTTDGAAAAAAAASFHQTCRDLTLLGGHGSKGRSMLQAVCLDNDDHDEGGGGGGAAIWWLTSLNLNHCVGTDGGELIFKERGNYDETCRPCGIDNDSTGDRVMLRCSCLANTDGGAPRFTEISLGGDGDLGVKSINGRLVCGKHQGTKSPSFGATSGNGDESWRP